MGKLTFRFVVRFSRLTVSLGPPCSKDEYQISSFMPQDGHAYKQCDILDTHACCATQAAMQSRTCRHFGKRASACILRMHDKRVFILQALVQRICTHTRTCSLYRLLSGCVFGTSSPYMRPPSTEEVMCIIIPTHRSIPSPLSGLTWLLAD